MERNILYNFLSLIIFIIAFIGYYFYTEYYKRCKVAEKILLLRNELSKLLPYFHGNTKCTNIEILQGENKNFYAFREFEDKFECILWESKISIFINKDNTFDDVNNFLLEVIKELEAQLNVLFDVGVSTLSRGYFYDFLHGSDSINPLKDRSNLVFPKELNKLDIAYRDFIQKVDKANRIHEQLNYIPSEFDELEEAYQKILTMFEDRNINILPLPPLSSIPNKIVGIFIFSRNRDEYINGSFVTFGEDYENTMSVSDMYDWIKDDVVPSSITRVKMFDVDVFNKYLLPLIKERIAQTYEAQ